MSIAAGTGIVTVVDNQGVAWTIDVGSIEATRLSGRATEGPTEIVTTSGTPIFLTDALATVDAAIATARASRPTQPVSLSGVVAAISSGSYARVVSTGATVIKSGAGTLLRLIYGGNGTAVVATIYDNTAASGTVIMTYKGVLNQGETLEVGANFTTGLTVSLANASDITLVYR